MDHLLYTNTELVFYDDMFGENNRHLGKLQIFKDTKILPKNIDLNTIIIYTLIKYKIAPKQKILPRNILMYIAGYLFIWMIYYMASRLSQK